MTQATFLSTMELVLLKLIEHNGLDAKSFMQQLGFDDAAIPNPNERTSTQVADAYFAKAVELIPNPAFALQAAACWHPSNLGALGFAWLSSATLQEGLNRLVRYSGIIGQKASFQCLKTSKSTRLIHLNHRTDSAVSDAITDFSLSLIVDMCRKNAGPDFHPNLVKLSRQKPQDTKPYTTFFGCEVVFDAKENSLEIDRIIADSPLPTSNLELATTLDGILSKQLASLDKSNIVARCKHYFLMELTSGEPTEQALAKALGISLRSLQRKLAEDGTSYSRLFDEVRHELAQNYLSGSHRSVNEITFLLGFSEQSAFTRAFKRWHGKSPSNYRTENLALS
ncbi:MAG: AraC family transcriptional regulator [Arenimonas sp.]|nr:AraC family transcriptional regulator [Arenimonas sp.]